VKTSALLTHAFDNVETYIFTGKGNWTFQGTLPGPYRAGKVTGASGRPSVEKGKAERIAVGDLPVDDTNAGEQKDIRAPVDRLHTPRIRSLAAFAQQHEHDVKGDR